MAPSKEDPVEEKLLRDLGSCEGILESDPVSVMPSQE